MALITRLTRLFRADIHSVLDRIEEPEALLRQSIREMEEDLSRDEHRIKLLTLEQTHLCNREKQFNTTLTNLDEELDVCFDSGKDDLVRALIKRQLETRRLLEFTVNQKSKVTNTLTEMASRVEEHRSHLGAMQQKADMLCEEDVADTDISWPMGDPSLNNVITKEEVEVAFLREKQKRSRS